MVVPQGLDIIFYSKCAYNLFIQYKYVLPLTLNINSIADWRRKNV